MAKISPEEYRLVVERAQAATARALVELQNMSAALESMKTRLAYLQNLLNAGEFKGGALEIHRDEENELPGMG